ncbi:relaxase/mobilization nuclease domain-containing protein [Cryobacterium sp. TMT3-29-2]|uniref:relaxase/mobilization nuclease domain-containing protein n=1 Tax=Cryobacterium sp. TMT3-29-2 TaxID=2555867 RepID=UPI00143167CD|nr:relaxase/mobilization nuclease domain-containing protein [Cryobacterium sp. TMT3-29-2]
MSITTVAPVYDLKVRADYLTVGVGQKRHDHLTEGTDRLAPGFYCDAASVEEFVVLGDQLAKQQGRRVKAQSYVLSFSPDELDVNNEDDLRRVGDLGFLLAKRMHPHSPCLVVVHNDSKGGAGHAHVTVLNHDYATGKALRDYRVHWQVKRANDELMADEGMQVLAHEPKQPGSEWQARRGEMPAFEQQLGDALTDALADASSTDFDGFIAACAARDVEVVWQSHEVKSNGRRGKQQGDAAVGITYKTRDLPGEDGKPGRLRRRKASALSSDFTHECITAALDGKQRGAVTLVPAVTEVESALATQAPAIDLASEVLSVLGRSAVAKPQLAGTPARAAVSRLRVRSILLSRLEGVLMQGLFLSLPGWTRRCAMIGIRALQHRGDLAYQLQGHSYQWDAADLGEQYTASAVSELASEISELRNAAPADANELPIPQLMELLDEIDDDNTRLPRRRKRETPVKLTPARERHLSTQRGDRSYGG